MVRFPWNPLRICPLLSLRQSVFTPALKGLGLFFLCLGVLACGGGRPTASIAGKVVFNNGPLEGGSLVFDYGEGVSKTVSLSSTGTFNESALFVGSAKVGVVPPAFIKGSQNSATAAKMKVPKGFQGKEGYFGNTKEFKVAEKYKDPNTSGLTVEIKAGKNPDVTFEIK